MTIAETWNLNNNFVEETETGMELESWMIKEWNTKNDNIEPVLTVESWMINSNLW
jgi:hypothetical protein